MSQLSYSSNKNTVAEIFLLGDCQEVCALLVTGINCQGCERGGLKYSVFALLPETSGFDENGENDNPVF